MGTDLSIFLLLAFACSFGSLYAETRKELRSKDVNQEPIIQLGRPIQSNRVDPSRVTQLSGRPRVFLYKGFLLDEECDNLISQALDKAKNLVGNGDDSEKLGTNKQLISSENFTIAKDDIAAVIEERISAWTFLPKEDSKPLQVLHFEHEDVKTNYDYFGNKSALAPSETLMATVILYLSNVTQGGQILFPESELENSKGKNKIWSDCTKSSNTLRPTKGSAILFFNLHLNASLDKTSSHGRCPVSEGDMWCATKFFHVRAVSSEKGSLQSDGSDCTDEDENCPRWAALGECQKNPVFMLGSPDYYGTCRKSCNACSRE